MGKEWGIIILIVLVYIPVFYKMSKRISVLEDEVMNLKKELKR